MGLAIYEKFERLLLEAEVSPTAQPNFIERCTRITGEDPCSSDSFQPQENKWGVEARIYFDAPESVVESFTALEYYVENRAGGGYRSDYAYRINNQDLFWRLVRHGYRLGPNDPMRAR